MASLTSSRARATSWSLAAWLALAPAGAVQAAPVGDGVLDIAYSAQMFGQVDVNDALAATQVWVNHFMATIGRVETSRTHVYHSLDVAERAVTAAGFDLLVMMPTEYVELAARVELVPLLVPLTDGLPGYTYILLCRDGVEDLNDLRGHDLLVARGGRDMPLLWLQSVLAAHGLPATNDWFGQVRDVERVASAVLPVFFGDVSACLVALGPYETMREMNPQLGRQLHALATSPLISPAIICLRAELHEEYGDILVRGMRSLHEDAKGQQVLALFGIDQLVPFEDEFLDSVRALRYRPQETP